MDSVTADGTVPDLANMTVLLKLDLSNNALKGPVPASLVNHPTLQILNMSFNLLDGVLPVQVLNSSGQSTSSLSIADFSHNRLTLTTVNLPSVHFLDLTKNTVDGKGEQLDVKLSSNAAFVDLRGNNFRCAYPTDLQKYSVLWEKCLMEATFYYFMAGLVFVVFTKLVYVMYRAQGKAVVQSNFEDAPVTSSNKFVATASWVGNALALVLPWFDTATDVQFNLEIQEYISSQVQFKCDVLNQKGMFDSTGYVVEGATYPKSSDYNNFTEYVQKVLVYFPVSDEGLQKKIQDFNDTCLGVNLPGLPPDCKYNATAYACAKVVTLCLEYAGSRQAKTWVFCVRAGPRLGARPR